MHNELHFLHRILSYQFHEHMEQFWNTLNDIFFLCHQQYGGEKGIHHHLGKYLGINKVLLLNNFNQEEQEVLHILKYNTFLTRR